MLFEKYPHVAIYDLNAQIKRTITINCETFELQQTINSCDGLVKFLSLDFSVFWTDFNKLIHWNSSINWIKIHIFHSFYDKTTFSYFPSHRNCSVFLSTSSPYDVNTAVEYNSHSLEFAVNVRDIVNCNKYVICNEYVITVIICHAQVFKTSFQSGVFLFWNTISWNWMNLFMVPFEIFVYKFQVAPQVDYPIFCVCVYFNESGKFLDWHFHFW